MGKITESSIDIGSGISEVAIDAMLNEGVLKDVPLVGSFVGLFKASVGVREHLFFKKLEAFLSNFEEISEAEKQQMRSRLENEEERERIGQKLVFVIERADELAKAKLLGKCFRRYLEGVILKDELLRFWHAVDRCFLSDLTFLPCYQTRSKEKQEAGTGLLATGLVNQAGIDAGEIGVEESGGILFELSPLGKKFFHVIQEG